MEGAELIRCPNDRLLLGVTTIAAKDEEELINIVADIVSRLDIPMPPLSHYDPEPGDQKWGIAFENPGIEWYEAHRGDWITWAEVERRLS